MELHFVSLRSKNLDEFSSNVANWASRKICAALEATDLVPARRHHAIDCIVVANNALLEKSDEKNEM